ncbi:GGDEF domain-containing protein [Marinospirillum sp. MEB164]|uniref:diguanylate cyclase n=1 Tax=Marinospirillum alkalitolerans TaxID=3123374 RepID=A0ABW8PW39_9GAMM
MPLHSVMLALRLLAPPALFLAAGLGLFFYSNFFEASSLAIARAVIWIFVFIALLLTLAYSHSRAFGLVLGITLAYWVLREQIALPALQAQPIDQPALVYNLLSFLFPLYLVTNSLWPERLHLISDLLLRGLVLGGFFLVGYLALTFLPERLDLFFSPIHLPSLHLAWLRLPQPSSFVFLLSSLLLAFLLIRRPQPFYAAQLACLIGFIAILPYFAIPYLASISVSLLLFIIGAAVIHEAFNMAFKDDLTGLPGRRALNQRLARLGKKYTLVMADVDHFKKFNDTYGHDAGDQVLQVVAHILKGVEGGGQAYRYGGEEFTLVFAGQTAEAAQPYVEQVRQRLADYSIALRGQERPAKKPATKGPDLAQRVKVTMSFGVAEKTPDLLDAEAVIKAADQALYAAKKAGRNCVALAGSKKSARFKAQK